MAYINKNAVAYLKQIPTSVKTSDFPLTKINASRLEGFQRELPVFDGVKMTDIAFLTKNLSTINLFRGCKWGCLHCVRNAVAPKAGRESILFEDLRRILLGFRTLSERLGFDVLSGNKFLNIVEDSNPNDIAIKGEKHDHSVVEAMKLMYNSLNIPAVFTTSGWDEKGTATHMYSYNVAKSLVTMIKNNPDSVKEVQVSINPFLVSDNYVQRMVRTLFAFLDLFKMNKASIIYKHAAEGYKNFDTEAAKKLYEKIYKELQLKAGERLEGIPELKPEVVTAVRKVHFIEPEGRGGRFFSTNINDKIKNELNKELSEWQNLTPEEQRHGLLDNAKKGIDIDGSIYAVMSSRTIYGTKPTDFIMPTDFRLNFIDKTKPNPIFNEMPSSKTVYKR